MILYVHLDLSSTSQWHSIRGSARNFSGSDAPPVTVSAMGCRMSLASNLKARPVRESYNVHFELGCNQTNQTDVWDDVYSIRVHNIRRPQPTARGSALEEKCGRQNPPFVGGPSLRRPSLPRCFGVASPAFLGAGEIEFGPSFFCGIRMRR